MPRNWQISRKSQWQYANHIHERFSALIKTQLLAKLNSTRIIWAMKMFSHFNGLTRVGNFISYLLRLCRQGTEVFKKKRKSWYWFSFFWVIQLGWVRKVCRLSRFSGSSRKGFRKVVKENCQVGLTNYPTTATDDPQRRRIIHPLYYMNIFDFHKFPTCQKEANKNAETPLESGKRSEANPFFKRTGLDPSLLKVICNLFCARN